MLDRNIYRLYAIFVNDSDETIYLALGDRAIASTGIRLNASGGSLILDALSPWYGQISAICATGGKKLLVTEVSRYG